LDVVVHVLASHAWWSPRARVPRLLRVPEFHMCVQVGDRPIETLAVAPTCPRSAESLSDERNLAGR
jgi:hypothetical protein